MERAGKWHRVGHRAYEKHHSMPTMGAPSTNLLSAVQARERRRKEKKEEGENFMPIVAIMSLSI